MKFYCTKLEGHKDIDEITFISPPFFFLLLFYIFYIIFSPSCLTQELLQSVTLGVRFSIVSTQSYVDIHPIIKLIFKEKLFHSFHFYLQPSYLPCRKETVTFQDGCFNIPDVS